MLKKIKSLITRPEFIVTIISCLFTIFVSCLVGIGGFLLFKNFWGTFFIALSVQFVFFFILNTVLQKKDDIEATKITTDQLNALSKYIIKLTCAYCSKSTPVPIVLNKENRFKCESCQQVNGVKMQFFSTQITVPLEKIVLPDNIEYNTKP